MSNFLCLCENAPVRGVACLLEHPADGEDPRIASTFDTDELRGVEDRTGSHRRCIEQCAFVGPTGKSPTPQSLDLHS